MNKLIVIEGIDGSGKATQAKLLSESLARQGSPFLLSPAPVPWDLQPRRRSQSVSDGARETGSSSETQNPSKSSAA